MFCYKSQFNHFNLLIIKDFISSECAKIDVALSELSEEAFFHRAPLCFTLCYCFLGLCPLFLPLIRFFANSLTCPVAVLPLPLASSNPKRETRNSKLETITSSFYKLLPGCFLPSVSCQLIKKLMVNLNLSLLLNLPS